MGLPPVSRSEAEANGHTPACCIRWNSSGWVAYHALSPTVTCHLSLPLLMNPWEAHWGG